MTLQYPQRFNVLYLLTLSDLGVFAEYLIKNIKSIISSQLHTPEKWTKTRLKGLVLGFDFGHESPCRRAIHSSEF